MKNKILFTGFLIIPCIGLLSSGCLRYLTGDRTRAIVEGIDVGQSLVIARMELEGEEKFGSVLTLWALRDQFITPAQADTIHQLYFRHIDRLKSDFNVWHLTWAISNMYRSGNDSVRTVLERAMRDASKRAGIMGGLADRHVNGEKIYHGDAHFLGRAYARKHLVAPNNKEYLQSAEDYSRK